MTLPALGASEFADFFAAVHGVEPFPWQERLASRIASGDGWPSVLDLPTGAGKTAAIDVALFHLALEAERGESRRAPVRVAFVVDRRLIVDAARNRADLIADKLAAAVHSSDSGHVIARVAKRLAHLAGAPTPVLVRALRGGAPREDDWARTPSQPTVLCSTVDQVGSRLLFRGYGVSDSMKPLHAGLIGSDCLILLDEAHLSEPFRQTLGWVHRYRRDPWAEREPGPWTFVTLTATPGTREATPFGLTQADRDHPVLSRRLSATKSARLVAAMARAADIEAHARELTEQAWPLSGLASGAASPRVVAIVVNRVALARACHAVITARIDQEGCKAEAILLIGRTREVDRAALIDRFGPELLCGRADPLRTLFVVATQCIEAGADFDFDALVTQIAPLDALRQRFGRLNRAGRALEAQAVIVACRDEFATNADDPLYGTRAKAAWEWLLARPNDRPTSDPHIDFGIIAMDTLLAGHDMSPYLSEKRDAPTMMPAYVDLWSQTSPVPAADPEPALFLHGVPDAADVQIAWRADIDLRSSQSAARAIESLALMPPRAAETVSVPIWAARAWLAREPAAGVSDLEGSAAPEERSRAYSGTKALRWRGRDSEHTGLVSSRELRPGDLIVAPGSVGGCDSYGWEPTNSMPVRDVADAAAAPFAPRHFVFRVHRALLTTDLDGVASHDHRDDASRADEVWSRVLSAAAGVREETDGAVVADALAAVDGLPQSWSATLRALAASKRVVTAFPYDNEESEQISGLVLVALKGIDREGALGVVADEAVTDDNDAGSFRASAVSLDRHSVDVRDKARAFARSTGLDTALAADVALAAFLHDEGKRDLRFQAYLRRGDRFLAAADSTVLAKSGTRFISRQSEARARRAAELPDRWRHEADSVRRAVSHPRFGEANDPHLVLWLIGTHHGYGRPLYPHADPLHDGPQDLDFIASGDDWPQLFARLKRRYGAWELARLEAILRLADHRASEEEQA